MVQKEIICRSREKLVKLFTVVQVWRRNWKLERPHIHKWSGKLN